MPLLQSLGSAGLHAFAALLHSLVALSDSFPRKCGALPAHLPGQRPYCRMPHSHLESRRENGSRKRCLIPRRLQRKSTPPGHIWFCCSRTLWPPQALTAHDWAQLTVHTLRLFYVYVTQKKLD